MHRITCWNGFVFVAAICLGLMVTSARGGSLDAPAGPASSNSAMFTLDDIYHKLNMRTNVTKRTGGFSEPSAAPTTGTMHTLNEIMILATNRAPVPMTRQTTVYAVGDDGTYGTSLGVAWPNPRFTVVGASGTAETNQIRDNLTGLIWAKNANLASNSAYFGNTGKVTWSNAFDVITNSAGPVNGALYGGTNDWRLPNFKELLSLADYRWYAPGICNTDGTAKWTTNNPFTDVRTSDGDSYYWSSTTSPKDGTTVNAFLFRTYDSYTALSGNKTGPFFVWPVRGGR